MTQCIDPTDKAFFPWKENFVVVSPECRCKNMEAAFNRDMELCKAYVGRELLEMMQNADDQKSSVLEFRLDSARCRLTITNSGKDTIPFNKAGFECLIRADTSEKRVMGNSAIGYKGYGFRALLNWAEEIVIHSNGVVFTFSEDARKKAWKTICEKSDPEFEREKDKLLGRIERSYGAGCIPLSIMSAPAPRAESISNDGPSWTEQDGYITRIDIQFSKSKLEEVKRQLADITPESLLFLRHLRTVLLTEQNGDEPPEPRRRLSCEMTGTGAVGGLEITELTLQDGATETPWQKAVRSVGQNEIAVVWRADRRPVDTARRVAYTYFPTTFQLPWLPCILHATFDLDPSRNGVNRSRENDSLMHECGAFLADVAAGIAASTDWNGDSLDDDQVWFPYDMLDMGDVVENDDLRRSLQEGLQGRPTLCPVTSRRYLPKEEVECYGAELASFLVTERETDCFVNHVWHAFERRKIVPRETPRLGTNAEALLRMKLPAGNDQEPTLKIDFSAYVATLAILLGIQKKIARNLRISCLPDLRCRIVDKNTTGYVNCGEMLVGAADSLGIHYVHPRFVSQCHDVNLFTGIWDQGRGLVAKLKDVCKCSSSDINPMKDLLVLRSNQGFPDARGGRFGPENCFQEVVKSLYAIYVKKPESASMSLYFHVLCEDGTHHEASDTCLWDEDGQIGIASFVSASTVGNRWRMKGSLQFWQSFLEAEDAGGKEKVKDFFHEFLGVSLGFPCKVFYCSQCDHGYLEEQCQSAESDSLRKCKPHYFNEWAPPSPNDASFHSSRELESNTLYALDTEFVQSLESRAGIDIFELVLKDPVLCRRIAYSPVVFAKYRGLKTCTFKDSYLAYSMQRMPWVAEITVDVVEERIKDWDARQKLRARTVMRVLGISRELEDLPVEEIYNRIAFRTDPRGIGSFYSKARMAIRKRIKEGTVSEECCAQLARTKLERLFARVKNAETRVRELRLVDRDDIWYWDNALVSKSLLDSLPKLEIGNRIGAASVEKLFGVHQLKPDDIQVLETVARAEERSLSDAANARLRKVRAYLLAARFRDEWREEDRPDIKSEAGRCKSFEIRVIRPVPGAFQLNGDGRTFGLSNGDLLQDEHRYWICSTATTAADLWSGSAFRSAVVEALCIHFQLATGTQIESGFREVLRNTEQENEEVRRQALPDDRWDEILSSLGISDDERDFWKAVAVKAGVHLTDDGLDSSQFEDGGWKNALKDWFRIPDLPPQIAGLDDFPKMGLDGIMAIARWCKMAPGELSESVLHIVREHLVRKAEDWRFRAEAEFATKLRMKLSGENADAQRRYRSTILRFRELSVEGLAERFISERVFPEDTDQQIKKLFCSAVQESFSIQLGLSEVIGEPEPLPEYRAVLKGRKLGCLSAEEQSLAFFPGNEQALQDAFHRLEAKHIVPSVEEDDGTELVEECVLRAADLKHTGDFSVDSSRTRNARSGGADFDSDAEKMARGESAEKIAERMLIGWKNNGKCLRYGKRSSLSSDTGTADDGAHFDFWYETPGHEIRLLEVKYYAGRRVMMSKGEYEKATSVAWRNRYDLVLVLEGRPYILRGPLFGEDSEFKDSLKKEVAAYNLRIEMNLSRATSSTPAPSESTP